jgi:NTE family protein
VKTFALALGGGGARGLAHISIIETLDDMGIKPVAIAGTSIGALVGAAYAAGYRGKELRRHVIDIAHNRPEVLRRLVSARAGTVAELLTGGLSQATLVDGEKFCAQFLPAGMPEDFSELAIPLKVMATDLHRRQEAALSSGPLRAALAASIAIPGLFRPVTIGGRVMIDGGATNPLPFDVISGLADVIVAVDVFGTPSDRDDMPSTWECLYTTVLIMGGAIVAAKHRHLAPDLTIRPNVVTFRTMDFAQASAILRAADAIKPEMRDSLGALLSAAP